MNLALALYPVFCGLVSGIGSTLVSVDFARALIIAVVTGILTAIGTVLGAVVASKYAQRTAAPIDKKIDHIQAAVGASRRADDDTPMSDNPRMLREPRDGA